MHIKKFVTITLLCFCAFLLSSCCLVSAIAEGSYGQPQNTNLRNGAYIAANVGYAVMPFQRNFGTVTTASDIPANATISWKNGSGGFVWGADIGYQFQDYLAVEIGAFQFPEGKASLPNNANQVFNKFNSWAFYGALKFIAPIFEQFAVFAKAGAGYYKQNAHPLNYTAYQGSDRFSPVFAAGFSYTFINSMMLDFTWTYISDNHTPTVLMPHVNALTFGIGYKFES